MPLCIMQVAGASGHNTDGPLHHQKADGKFACQLGLSRSVSAHAEGTRGLNLDRGRMSEMFSRRELESVE